MPVVLKTLLIATLVNSLLFSNAFADDKPYVREVCELSLTFDSEPKEKNQDIKLNDSISMHIANAVAVNEEQFAAFASNVTCQVLTGADYTGSDAEWAKFFDSAFTGLVNAGYKEIEFTLVGTDDAVFTAPLAKEFDVKEYNYRGNIKGNKQYIKNVALLNKKTNTLYTFSVSGSSKINNLVNTEFKRLVNSIKAAD